MCLSLSIKFKHRPKGGTVCLFLSCLITEVVLCRHISDLNEDRAEISSSTQIKLSFYYRPFQTLHLVPRQMNMSELLNVITAMSANLLLIKHFFFSCLKGILESIFEITTENG